jgi:hypothetical protein
VTPRPRAACSLNPHERADRMGEFARLFSDALLSSRLDASGLLLSFAPRPGVIAAMRDLLAREARCCPFLHSELVEEEAALEVRVSAPEAGAGALANLFGLAREALAGRPR